MDNDPPNDGETWAGAFRQQILWFVFALILASGTTYFQVRLNVTTVKNNLANAKADLQELRSKQQELDRRREELRLNINNLDQKINAILRDRGIDPTSLKRIDQRSND